MECLEDNFHKTMPFAPEYLVYKKSCWFMLVKGSETGVPLKSQVVDSHLVTIFLRQNRYRNSNGSLHPFLPIDDITSEAHQCMYVYIWFMYVYVLYTACSIIE